MEKKLEIVSITSNKLIMHTITHEFQHAEQIVPLSSYNIQIFLPLHFQEDEGLLANAKVERMGNNKRMALIKDSRVTTEEKKYLSKNTAWSKEYSLAKEIRDSVK